MGEPGARGGLSAPLSLHTPVPRRLGSVSVLFSLGSHCLGFGHVLSPPRDRRIAYRYLRRSLVGVGPTAVTRLAVLGSGPARGRGGFDRQRTLSLPACRGHWLSCAVIATLFARIVCQLAWNPRMLAESHSSCRSRPMFGCRLRRASAKCAARQTATE